MKLRLATLVGALSLVATAPAVAQTTATITIGGTASAVCSAAGTFAAINVGDMVVAGTGGLNAATVNGRVSTNTTELFCNGVGSTLLVTAAPLTGGTLPDGAAGAGFANVVNFTATATVAAPGYSSVPGFSAADSTLTASTATPIGLLNAPAGSFSVALSAATLPSGATRLLANPTYAGSVTLTLAPLT